MKYYIIVRKNKPEIVHTGHKGVLPRLYPMSHARRICRKMQKKVGPPDIKRYPPNSKLYQTDLKAYQKYLDNEKMLGDWVVREAAIVLGPEIIL